MSNFIIGGNSPIHLVENAQYDSMSKPTKGDRILERACLETLWKHYPGASWRVDVNGTRGTVDVFCLNLSSRWGVRWKLGRIYGDPDMHWIKMAGGELLERANIARGTFDEDKVSVGRVEGIQEKDQPINGIPI